MKHEKGLREGGTFTVSGAGHTAFKLESHAKPKFIHVDFDGHCPPVVCNPHHHDSLEWELEHSHHGHPHKYEIVIKWHVTAIRHISWYVVYG